MSIPKRYRVTQTLTAKVFAKSEEEAKDRFAGHARDDEEVTETKVEELAYDGAWLPESMRETLSALRFAEGRTMTVREGEALYVTNGHGMYRVLEGKVGTVDREVGGYAEAPGTPAPPKDWKPATLSAPRRTAASDVKVRDFAPANVAVNDLYVAAAEALYGQLPGFAWYVSKAATMVEARDGEIVLARIMGLRAGS